MSNQRKTFTKEFKLEAIRLMSESDKLYRNSIGTPLIICFYSDLFYVLGKQLR
jgi:hypothetical protein